MEFLYLIIIFLIPTILFLIPLYLLLNRYGLATCVAGSHVIWLISAIIVAKLAGIW